jgi:hypothetical protein
LPLAVVLTVALLAFASSADAAYEQLPGAEGSFGGSATPIEEGEQFSEEVQLGGTGSVAINRTGEGGVPPGTVYAVTEAPEAAEPDRIVMYEPRKSPAGNILQFEVSWEISRAQAYERCGPLLGLDTSNQVEHPCTAHPEGGSEPAVGIAVDQATGYVYAFSRKLAPEESGLPVPGSKVLVAYNSDGSEVLARFGETAVPYQTVAKEPTKVHIAPSPSLADSIAVNTSGELFVYDLDVEQANYYQRLMVFRPHEGNFAEYEYAGEIAGSTSQTRDPRAPAFDDKGNLYVAGILGGGDHIEALNPESPGPYPTAAKPPRCEYKVKGGGTSAMTIDPASGDPFFYSEKRPGIVSRTGPCEEETGKFAESAEPEQLSFLPSRTAVFGLAFDPGRETGNGRPDGALYGASSQHNENELGASALGFVLAHPEKLEAPKIAVESISHVTASDALAKATIEPNALPTEYVFEYLTEAQWLADGKGFEAAVEAPIGRGTAAAQTQSLSVVLGPLAPATAYRFRLVATNKCRGGEEPACVSDGEALAFHTFPISTPLLPDGRAWELVSPSDKSGGQVLPANPSIYSCGVLGCKPGTYLRSEPMQSSPDGEAVAYEGTNFGGGGSPLENAYLARRNSSSGWQTTNPAPPLTSRGGRYQALAPRMGLAVLQQSDGAPALAPGVPAGYPNLYVQLITDPLTTNPLLTTSLTFHRSIEEFNIQFAGMSADGPRVFFAANDVLTPEAEDGGVSKFNLYEWHAGQVSLVNLGPGGETEAGASFGTASANTVSADGSRAFFSDQAGQVYVRIDGRETRRIEDSGRFLAASTDGWKVLLSDGCLYSVAAENCIDLTHGKGGFEGELGQSDDLGKVFFVDSQVLDSGANPHGEVAELGANNLYASNATGLTHFVARLATADNGEELEYTDPTVDWAKIPANRTAEASPNGRYLAFLSERQLGNYGNVGPCVYVATPEHFVEGPCPEVYIYDFVTGRLVCASCNPSGAAPLGRSLLERINGGSAFPQPRYLTDEGRAFFDSRDSLIPLDTNDGVEDVYGWEPQGSGGCASGFAEGGCVALISSGRGRLDSNLVAVNEGGEGVAGGHDVFFSTADRLVASDKDEVGDLYDAREGGGFAAESEAVPIPCQGEACQGPQGGSPSQSQAGSSSYAGAGNPKPAKPQGCPKGKVKKGDRCVKKSHHKKDKRQKQKHRKARHSRANADRRPPR